jgi:methyl-accepting chemotaxis protein
MDDSATPSRGPGLSGKLIRRPGIVSRLTLISVLTMVAAVGASIYVSAKTIEAPMYRRAQADLAINIKLLDSLLAAYGKPTLQGDKLYFGTTLINGNFDAVDHVKAVAGGTATVFLGDRRISTNVRKPDGSRAVGTELAPGPAYQSVFEKHQTYSGEAEILGQRYLTIYEPIISGGKVLGIAYVGVRKAEFFNVLRRLVLTNLGWSSAVIFVAGICMMLLIRRTFAPIRTIRDELIVMARSTSQKELDARTLASLDRHLDDLRRTLYARGQPRYESDLLFFGDEPVNDDLGLVDAIGARDGTLVSIFLKDCRVATNVCRSDGSRIIGSLLESGPVYDRVLKEGRSYRGDANIFGVPHFSIYEPIRSHGEVIGILFVGKRRLSVSTGDSKAANTQPADEIAEMRAAVAELGKAAMGRETAEQQAAELRQRAEEDRQARDAEQALAARRRARAVKERANAMEEISSTVRQNAASAAQADHVATETCTIADRGGQVAAKAVDAMARIEESSRRIADIIAVIDEIARQTNLLALNAAIEAARAGETGRGFAVVATEVRNLAQRSAQAAKDINGLISASSQQVHDGVVLVNSAGKSLGEIVESIKRVAGIVSGIAVGSNAQAANLEQINRALTQLDEISQTGSEGDFDAADAQATLDNPDVDAEAA